MNHNYKSIIRMSIDKVYQTGITTKILQHMAKIRNSSSVIQARRWVMELLQNSQDVAYPDKKVKVRIELTEDELIYSHNGKPFRVKDILSIINQVSSKSDDEETVGQFGTGFVTTFQLSEMVRLDSILQDEVVDESGNAVLLPCKPFSITLDRRGTTDDEIFKSIEKTMKELEQVDEVATEIEIDWEQYYTSFHYQLSHGESKKIARIGMDDLDDTIHYILCFSEKIEQVELIYHTSDKNQTITYKVMEERTQSDFQVKKITTEFGEASTAVEECEMWSLVEQQGDKKVTLAGMVKMERKRSFSGYEEYELQFVPISDKTPRLFIDFPLLGAESFPFPLVVNADFKPNEPRSGISLSDNVNSSDAKTNKQLMQMAVRAYQRFLAGAIGLKLGKLQHILSIPEWVPNAELSESWVLEHIYEELTGIIKQQHFLPGKDKMLSLSDGTVLIKGDTFEEREFMRVCVLSQLQGFSCPQDQVDWAYYLRGYPSLEKQMVTLSMFAENAQEYSKKTIDNSERDRIFWINVVYDVAMKNEALAQRIRAGEIAIFPSQAKEDEGRLFTITQIYKDPKIPEVLKDVSEQLDQLSAKLSTDHPLHIRHELLHKEFISTQLQELRSYETDRLINYIIKRSDREFMVKDYNYHSNTYLMAWHKAWYYMLSCGKDQKLYQLLKKIFSDRLPEYKALEEAEVFYQNDQLWRNSYRGLVLLAIGTIQRYSKKRENSPRQLLTFAEQFFEGKEQETIQWLNDFYEREFSYLSSSTAKAYDIFPVQTGEMKRADLCYVDTTKDDQLKDIAEAFVDLDKEMKYREVLLRREIKLSVDAVVLTKGDSEIAVSIDRTLNKILSERKLKEEPVSHQQAGTKLLSWIRKHIKDGLALTYFPSFSSDDDQMRLLTPEAATEMTNKAEVADKLMEKLDCKNPEEMLDKLEQFGELLNADPETLKKMFDAMMKGKNGRDLYSKEEKDSNRVYFSGEYDVFFDSELRNGFASDEEFDSFCRRVGRFGEEFAFEELRQRLLERGYVEDPRSAAKSKCESRSFTRQEDGKEEMAVLTYPDFYNTGSKQSGYDIRLSIKTGSGEWSYHFYEVKTHTTTSIVRGYLELSDQQMRKALKEKENYSILNVLYHRFNEKESEIEEFPNPEEQIVHGRLSNESKRYRFRIQRGEYMKVEKKDKKTSWLGAILSLCPVDEDDNDGTNSYEDGYAEESYLSELI